jgi:hypothetical protein
MLYCRQKFVLIELIDRIYQYQKQKINLHDAWNHLQNIVISLANAYINRITYKIFYQHQTESDQKWLQLYGISLLTTDMNWFLSNSLISKSASRLIDNYGEQLASELVTCLPKTIESFNIPDFLWDVPMLHLAKL